MYGNPDQNVYECLDCGHLFLAPLLSDEQEESFYVNEFPAFLVKRGDFKNINPSIHFDKNAGEAHRRFSDINHLLGKDKTVLEIGSATGFFLYQLKVHVASVTGVEPNQAYQEFAASRGIESFATLSAASGRKFDLIFSYYVLEHLKDPIGFLESVKALLSDHPDACIIMEIPNAKEALISLYKSPAYDSFVWQRAHCSYFSTEVLGKVFSKLGMAAEFTPVQRYDLSNHLFWLAQGKPGGMGKYSSVISPSLDEKYRQDLKKQWMCDSILAVAKRPFSA